MRYPCPNLTAGLESSAMKQLGWFKDNIRGQQVDLKKQRAFAEKWRVWKTDGYYSIEMR